MSSTDLPDQAGIAARVAEARRELEAQMSAMGLTHAKGWSILERVIDARGGSVWVLLPYHLKERAPDGLGATIFIDGQGRVRG